MCCLNLLARILSGALLARTVQERSGEYGTVSPFQAEGGPTYDRIEEPTPPVHSKTYQTP